jgi:hypothetical protein
MYFKFYQDLITTGNFYWFSFLLREHELTFRSVNHYNIRTVERLELSEDPVFGTWH